MQKQKKYLTKIVKLATSAGLVLGALTTALPAPSALASAAHAPAGPYGVHLPLIMRPSNQETVFGVQMDPIGDGHGLSQLAAIQTTWTRRNGLLWSSVEPSEGARNWGAIADLEQELVAASQKGIKVILIVRGAPAWARQVADSECGPIRADKYAAFGAFMHDVVARYSVAPYNIKNWEIWNEQDIAVKHAGGGGTDEYGCWGDPSDAYFGGGAYGEMLKVIAPQMKSADAQAQVIVGGLLLDCDPINPPAGKDCSPARFFEGILRSGAGSAFDGVAFHAYDYYEYALGKYSNSNWHSAWNTTGPVLIAKVRFLKQLLAAYNVTGKYLMNTESALLCFGCGDAAGNGDTFRATKASYIVQANAAAMAEGLKANIWYNVHGWFYSGLFDTWLVQGYTFRAFNFERQLLRSSPLSRVITEYPGVMGYEFNRGDMRIWVLWSATTASHAITLPALPGAVYDTFGASRAPATSLTVDQLPVYVVWNP